MLLSSPARLSSESAGTGTGDVAGGEATGADPASDEAAGGEEVVLLEAAAVGPATVGRETPSFPLLAVVASGCDGVVFCRRACHSGRLGRVFGVSGKALWIYMYMYWKKEKE